MHTEVGRRAVPLLPGAALLAVLALGCSRGGKPPPGRAAVRPAVPAAVPAAGVLADGETDGEAGRELAPHEYVACPVPGRQLEEADRVLDEAAARFDAREFAVALACAELASDLLPQAVEPHHLRAAALSGLGRHLAAQTAFAMALALDPDDPETLAAAADFYINVLPPKRRDTTLVGLEYARRGSERAATRRRRDRSLRARLLLLQAQALNDLGGADAALPSVDAALALAPNLVEAAHERGVCLFNLCRFTESEEAFRAVLRRSPDDPYAHHHLGLIYERLGRHEQASGHFARARGLAPEEFGPEVAMSSEEFAREVDRAIAELTPEVRALLGDVRIELADLPSQEDLTAVEPPFSPTILGLYRGFAGPDEAAGQEPHVHAHSLGAAGAPPAPPHPATAAVTRRREGPREPGAGAGPERSIVLYRKNLARAVKSRAELLRQIRKTLVHELGHLQGYDENELRRRGLE
jgi:predicted Zn-dependent protease with MMP-like domain